ncbi:MAG: peptidylprolyl isomerase [Spirochaetaceae bacterium]|jgi:FKBP-type peptidyl-prolyl cis-trans isomerase SlyD|nr:peptidylprolyl isomerase [Spirochaetaceae bacterium]
MTISKDRVAAIDYCLKDNDGAVIDSTEGGPPLEYLHGHGNVIPGLERELEGREPGAVFDAVIEPEEGYGAYREDLVIDFPKDSFPPGARVRIGERFQAEGPNGAFPVTVVKAGENVVTVDGNHPLAGKKLFFNVRVVSVRDATQEELAFGLCGCSSGCDSCPGCH